MNIIPLHEDWLAAMCELWNRELGGLFPMREQLMRQNTFQDQNVYAAALSWRSMTRAV